MRRLCLMFVACWPVLGQSFEVASIKPAAPAVPLVGPGMGMRMGCNGGPGSKDPGRWSCENMTVTSLISMAYELKRYQMPDQSTVQADRFNIGATVPEGTTREQFRLMQRNLLKERFKLALHFEKKETPGYELVAAKGGPKLKEAAPPKEIPDQGPPPFPVGPAPRDKDGFPILPVGQRGMIMESGRATWASPDASTEQIANMLGSQLNRPVMDATGLTGKYDVRLRWVSEGVRSAEELDSGPTLLTAIQEQLGLKLQAKKAAVDVVVIDHVEKMPTEN